MKIGVFLSSRMGKDPVYAEAARRTGELLASQGHELVYGGENYGLMSVLADSVRQHGGRVNGVIPNIPMMLEHVYPDLQEAVYVRDMSERKAVMMRLADAFLALPGGPGTLDEFSEVFCLNKIGEIDKPLVLVNIKGFYDPMKDYLKKMEEEGMADLSDEDSICVKDTPDEAIAFLKAYIDRCS